MRTVYTQKKGQQALTSLIGVAVVFLIMGIVIAFGLLINSNVQDEFTPGTLEYNATVDTATAMSEISSWQPTLALLFVAGIIIAVVIGFLRFRGSK